MPNTSVTIPAGNSVELTVEWLDTANQPVAPDSVVYEVFDARTGASVSTPVSVPDPTSSMSFIVSGDEMPGSTEGNRRLVIQIEGTFSGGDTHTEQVDVTVKRSF